MALTSDAEVIRRTQHRAPTGPAAPAVVGQVRLSVARRNWWTAAGWCLRGGDTVLLDLGRVQDASNYWDTVRQYTSGRRTPRRPEGLCRAARCASNDLECWGE